jgi:hypothetical protein
MSHLVLSCFFAFFFLSTFFIGSTNASVFDGAVTSAYEAVHSTTEFFRTPVPNYISSICQSTEQQTRYRITDPTLVNCSSEIRSDIDLCDLDFKLWVWQSPPQSQMERLLAIQNTTYSRIVSILEAELEAERARNAKIEHENNELKQQAAESQVQMDVDRSHIILGASVLLLAVVQLVQILIFSLKVIWGIPLKLWNIVKQVARLKHLAARILQWRLGILHSVTLRYEKFRENGGRRKPRLDEIGNTIVQGSFKSELTSLLKFFAHEYGLDSASRNCAAFRRANEIAKNLFERDYMLYLLENSKQVLCSSYPLQIFVPKEHSRRRRNTMQDNVDEYFASLHECFQKSRFARVHGRFIVPAIFLGKGRFVCRSSTLAIKAESILQTAREKIVSLFWGQNSSGKGIFQHAKQRVVDFYLMNKLNVKSVFDLMVESRKKLYGLELTSSEKAEPNKFPGVLINSIPYPGCEFFRQFKLDKNRSGVGLYYNWSLDFVNAKLQLNPVIEDLQINWSAYKSWDLVSLTNQYLRHIFASLSSSNASILVHCISGWDRTPLFISLIRICLWADGLAHESLDPEQFLFLTLSYDWLLFSHQLKNRIQKDEEIMYFCFHFLQFLDDRVEFVDSDASAAVPHSKAMRKERLSSLWSLFKEIYANVVDGNIEVKVEENEEDFVLV